MPYRRDKKYQSNYNSFAGNPYPKGSNFKYELYEDFLYEQRGRVFTWTNVYMVVYSMKVKGHYGGHYIQKMRAEKKTIPIVCNLVRRGLNLREIERFLQL